MSHHFPAEVYKRRRETLRKALGAEKGILFFPGNVNSPRTYAANIYPFRQDSTFLYFTGLAEPGMALIMDLDNGEDCIFGHEATMDDIVWTGPVPSLADYAGIAGVDKFQPSAALHGAVQMAHQKGRHVHFLPPYRGETAIQLHHLLGIEPGAADTHASSALVKAVIALREIKGAEEVEELHKACNLTVDIHLAAMQGAKPGIGESDVAGMLWSTAYAAQSYLSFLPIVSIDGQVLHNELQRNTLQSGRLLLVDAGAESPMQYAGDMTRTYPVDKKFTSRQRDVYEIALKANMNAIAALRPGIAYRDVHLLSARTIAEGLKGLGLMKGDPAAAVEAGAHALFFPHGLGHMMGLDVHDMENLGENNVGYDAEVQRSSQFGTAFLRLGKALKPGHVLTVEPGIYFIPELIDQWRADGLHSEFIDYDKVESYKDFGGSRIEDDYLITGDGALLLGRPLPKSIEEVEALRA